MQVPSLGRSPGKGHDNPLQYSCLENLMDRGAWWATVHRVAKGRTRLKRHSMHAYICVRVRCVNIYVCIYIYMCVCVYMCVYIYIYIIKRVCRTIPLLCLLYSGGLCRNSKIATGWWRMSIKTLDFKCNYLGNWFKKSVGKKKKNSIFL